MYFPKSAVPLNQTPKTPSQPSSGYMPKSAIPVQPEKKSFSGFMDNVGTSAVNAISGVGQALAHPINTLYNMGGLVAGVGSKFIPGRQKSEDYADAVGQMYKDRYGSWDKTKNTAYNDPVGVGLDVSTVLGGAGAAVKGVGTVGKVAPLVKAGNFLTKASEFADPFQAVGKVVGGVGSKFSGNLKAGASAESDKLLTAGLGNPARQVMLKEKYGTSVPGFMRKYESQYPGLMTRDVEAAQAARKGIGEAFDTTASQTNKMGKTSDIINSIDKEISAIKEGFGGQISEADAKKIAKLEEIKSKFIKGIVKQGDLQVVGVSENIKPSKKARDLGIAGNRMTVEELAQPQFSPLNVSLNDLTTFRRKVIDPDVPQSLFGLGAQEVGTAGGAKAARDIIRAKTIQIAPELQSLGMDYGMAKNVEDIIAKAASRASNRQLMNLHKLGGAGLGAFLGKIPGLVGGMVAEQVVNHPLFLSSVSNLLNSISQSRGLTINPLFSKGASSTYLFGKLGRATSASQK